MNEKLSSLEKIGNLFSTLLLGKTKEIIIRTDERVNNLTLAVSELKSNIKALNGQMMVFRHDIVGLKVHTKTGAKKIPTVPNESGMKLLEVSGFNKIYPQLKPDIFALMDAKSPRTLYDYEETAQKALEKLKDNPLMDCLKNHSVNHPDEPLDLIFKVASWVIRDDYARERRKGTQEYDEKK